MPNPSTLKIGDSIRLLRVPGSDLAIRERKASSGEDTSETTATAIERISEKNPVVTIARIDEFSGVWYEAELANADGGVEHHSVMLYDDDTWELLG